MHKRHRHRGRHGLAPHLYDRILRIQKNEVTEHKVYRMLARRVTDESNKNVLLKIAEEEREHAEFWKTYTEQDVRPNHAVVSFIGFISRFLGMTFAVKFMEKGEELAQAGYEDLARDIPEAENIRKAEEEHEQKLLGFLDEEGMRYVGSMVLGVNDALVELTGALAGLTLALQNGKLIAMTGLITGIAASLSMAASEYLSVKAEQNEMNPAKAALYTGTMYLVTVIMLILPYFLIQNIYAALGATLLCAVCIILAFTFYISVAQNRDFKRRFLEMAAISLSVATVSFGIGYLVRIFLGVDV